MDSSCPASNKSQVLNKLVGKAPALLQMIEQIPAVAGSEAPVLIVGETGTGKELIARAVHYLSPRAECPFVAVNCGALPETLLEDELFGHERGAFTSADSRRTGLIEQAEKGTLFLDEVDTLPAKAQVDLLRVLQDKKYRAIGSNREKEASVRIVAATNVPVDQLLSARAFRADLYYRLCVFLLRASAIARAQRRRAGAGRTLPEKAHASRKSGAEIERKRRRRAYGLGLAGQRTRTGEFHPSGHSSLPQPHYRTRRSGAAFAASAGGFTVSHFRLRSLVPSDEARGD